MDAVLLHVLKKRIETLQSLINDFEQKKAADAFTVGSAIHLKVALKVGLDNFNKEFNNYLQSCSSLCQQTVKTGITTKEEAEQLLIDTESSIETHSLGQCTSNNKQTPPVQLTKLPTLSLPKFDGDVLSFSEYWDRFVASVDSRDIQDVDKLTYLMGSLEGTALETVQGLLTTNENYKIAVDLLKKRFGNKNTIINAHYDALSKLRRAKDDRQDCRATLNTISRHLRVLSSLGEIPGNNLRTLIVQKFPERMVYELSVLKGLDSEIEELLSGLEILITALENAKCQSNPCNLPGELPPTMSTSSLHTHQAHPRAARYHHNRSRPDQRQSNVSRKRKIDSTAPTNSKKPRWPCIFCSKPDHRSADCKEVQSIQDRKKKLTGRCYRCFRPGHTVRDCKSKRKCYHCKRDHNQALCSNLPGNVDSQSSTFSTASQSLISKNVSSYLQTATTEISNNNHTETCRLILDSGSQRSYLTERMAKKLNLSTNNSDCLLIYTFGSDIPKEVLSASAEVCIRSKRGVNRNIRVNIVPYIADAIPVPKLNLPVTVDILADDDSVGEDIDLLIGNDLYFSFIKDQAIKIQDHLYLVNTDFGWICSGGILDDTNDNVLSVITYCQNYEGDCSHLIEPDLPLRAIDMKFMWSLESIGIVDSPKTTREEEAVENFNKTTRYEHGRYEVKWPWIQYPPDLPTNYGLAYGRLKSILRRSDESTFTEYDQILKQQLEANVIEVIKPSSNPSLQSNPPIHYLPHHMVKQKGKKGRIVYDASAKIKDQKSLNECMYRGPSMLEDLTSLLINFRTGKVGITADVERAFLQVGLQSDDRDVTRFLWVKDLKKDLTEDNLIHLRFCRVPFGVLASPFLLTATIRFHMSRTDKTLLSEVADKCYVDNLVTSVDSTESAEGLYTRTKRVFEELSMNIRDWATNDPNFASKIPEQYRTDQTSSLKVLGLIWNREKDCLKLNVTDKTFEVTEQKKGLTKKIVLRTIARFYDPCGLAAPLILPAKMFFQDLCSQKHKWDAVLPDETQQSWQNILRILEATKEVEVPRYVGIGLSEGIQYELHCFTDASKISYAAAIYLRIIGQLQTKSVLLMSKCRITPLEDKDDLKIPRLELLGFLIGCRLLKYVKTILNLQIERQCLWTDSLIVLTWVKSEKLLPPFVLRRVNEIKENRDVELRYVNSHLNPADVGTRPELWHQKSELWFNGPVFLTQTETFWPTINKVDQEMSLLLAEKALDEFDRSETAQSFEELNKPESEVPIHSIPRDEATPEDPIASEIKRLQKENFPEEVLGKETHLTRNLGLYLDVDGLLRCRGRMANSNWSYDMKHPVLIPKDCKFTNDLILKIHTDLYHVGVSHTLSAVRQNYWIPQGRSQVQKVLKKCPQCLKHGGGPYTLPPTPALPAERVNYSSPFTFTGIDYLGPVFVNTKTGKEKRWICLYTCLAVRAVHLEMVADMTAEECLLALRRFIAARGLPRCIVSDNALYFKLSAEVLSSPYCRENSIKWRFIPQLAPWHGGFYERLVALVKNCLKRTLEKHLLYDNQMLTVIKEIETVVNSRPLTTVGSEIEHILKPSDFLSLGKNLLPEPTEDELSNVSATKFDLINAWKRGHNILEEFKDMFVGRYLTCLRERYNSSPKQPRVRSDRYPQLGDIVQLKGDEKNRENWKVGKIISLPKGNDGNCRVAKVKVGAKEFIRSIAHLYPLELEEDTEITPNDVNRFQSECNQQTSEVERTTNLPKPSLEPNDPLLSSGLNTNALNPPSEISPPDKGSSPGTMQGETRIRREAAIKAREKIAQLSRHLLVLL